MRFNDVDYRLLALTTRSTVEYYDMAIVVLQSAEGDGLVFYDQASVDPPVRFDITPAMRFIESTHCTSAVYIRGQLHQPQDEPVDIMGFDCVFEQAPSVTIVNRDRTAIQLYDADTTFALNASISMINVPRNTEMSDQDKQDSNDSDSEQETAATSIGVQVQIPMVSVPIEIVQVRDFVSFLPVRLTQINLTC